MIKKNNDSEGNIIIKKTLGITNKILLEFEVFFLFISPLFFLRLKI